MKWTKARLGVVALVLPVVIITITVAFVLQTREDAGQRQWRAPPAAASASDRSPRGHAGDSPRGHAGDGAENNGPKVSGTPSTGSSRRPGTYKRESASGIYLDSLPGGEGDESPPPDQVWRINGTVAVDFPDLQVGSGIGGYPFRVSSTDGRPVNRRIRIIGPNAQDFPLLRDNCMGRGSLLCGPEGFFCAFPACRFATTFEPSAVGERIAWLEIGNNKYLLRGMATPGDADQGSAERNPNTSPSILPSVTPTPSSSAGG
jgi:hypothetical protein